MKNESHKILLVEDDNNLGFILSERLHAKGFEVVLCKNGEKGFKEFTENKFDLLILDIMMPLKDGFTLAKEIRIIDKDVPIVFVSARSLKEDILKGFDIGADDYVTKPFSIDELLMRIQAILKRTVKKPTENFEVEIFQLGNYVFNHVFQTLTIGSKSHKLTSKEADLMRILASNLNVMVSRELALKKIWGDDSYYNGRSMDVFISKLRKFLSDDPRVEILNVHSRGFKLVVKE